MAALRRLALTGACALLAACAAAPAQTPATSSKPALASKPANAASSSKAAVPTASASAPTANGSSSSASNLKPYAEVIKDFTRIPGWLNVYKKDERYLLELKEGDFAQPFFFTTHRQQGIGERFLWGGMMLESGVGQFVRLSDRVQWLEKNTRFIAGEKSPLQHALKTGFSDSLRGVAPILSQPHPSSRAILIDLNALALSDFSATASALQAIYRQPYQFDRNNSQILRIANETGETLIELQAHYAAAALAIPTPGQAVQPSVPQALPDARSMFFGLSLSFSPLPEAMTPRAADARVGYFSTARHNFEFDLLPDPREHLIHRWRLEKKDPAAALSEPKQPITYWLDRNIPERYRDTVRDAILAWNAAFARIGFKDAIVVNQQPDDATWRSASRLHASVQWYLGTDNGVAIGPSLVDPRSGEILDADIVIDEGRARGTRETARHELSNKEHAHADGEPCSFAEGMFEQMQHALDLSMARGEIEPDSPEAEALVRDTLTRVVMHEVGHTLGLRHNFRASSAYSLAQLNDPAFVAKNGLAASVMDYVPYRIPLKGEQHTAPTQRVLGPYDYWAIEYGYSQHALQDEAAALRNIAGRAADDPLLTYGEDSEAGSADGNLLGAGIDPAVARYDLGNDPVAWFQRQLQLSRELLDKISRRPPRGNPQEARETRSAVLRSLTLLSQAAGVAARNVGGISLSRSTTPQQRAVFTPIPAATQRATLAALSKGFFQPTSFQLDAALLRRLGPDTLDWLGSEPMLPLLGLTQSLQSRVLDHFFSDRVTQRLLESALLDKDSFKLSELYATLRQDIWAELKHGGDIPLMRRNLQRAHLSRLAAQILKPNNNTPADARALARFEAVSLQSSLRKALGQSTGSVETRAHLQESLATLDEALRAPLLRQTP